MRGRLVVEEGVINMGGLTPHLPRILAAPRIIIAACGTSWHAGLLGEYLIETLARVPVEVEYASEFRYRRPLLFKDDVLICISQSGETADTLAALTLAKAHGCLCIGVCNVVGSTIAPADTADGARFDFAFSACELRVGALTVPLPPVGRGWGELLYLDDELRVQRDVRGDVIIARKVGAA